MRMVWGIALGVILGGFVGLFCQVSNYAMWDIWLGVLAGGVAGGLLGWAYDRWRARREARRQQAAQVAKSAKAAP